MIPTPQNLNVETLLTREAGFDAPTGEADKLQEELNESERSGIVAALNRAVAELNYMGGDTQELLNLIRDVQAIPKGMPIPLEMANSARSAVESQRAISASASAAALSDAIEGAAKRPAWLSNYRLSAEGQAQVDSILENLRNGGSAEEVLLKRLPQPPSEAQVEGAKEFAASADGKKLDAQFRAWANGTPEEQKAFTEALRDETALDEITRNVLRDPKVDKDVKIALRNAYRDGMISGEKGIEVIETILQEQPKENVLAALREAGTQRFRQLPGMMAANEPSNPKYPSLSGVDKQLRSVMTAQQLATYERDPEGQAQVLQQFYASVGDGEAVERKLKLNHGDMSRMTRDEQGYILVKRMLDATAAEKKTRDLHDKTERNLDHLHGLEARRSERVELREKEAIATILDDGAGLAARARAAYYEIDKAREKGEVESKDYATGMSALVFAYAGTRGTSSAAALKEFDEKRKATTPEARAYMQEFQAYVDKQVGVIEGDYSRLGQQAAIEALGRQIDARQIEILQDKDGSLSFMDSVSGRTRETFLGDDGLAGLSVDYNEMMRDVLRDVRRLADKGTPEEKEFAALVRKMDTYRLQFDKGSQDLVREIYELSGSKDTMPQAIQLLKDKSADVNRTIAEYQARYSDYTTDVLRYAEKDQKDLLKPFMKDGELDVAALMQKVEDNKVLVGRLYRDYLDIPTTTLREANIELQKAEVKNGEQLPRVTSRDLADARMLSEIANQLRGADAIRDVVKRSDEIELQAKKFEDEGKPLPPALKAEHDLIHIMDGYDAETASPAQREALVAAVRAFMERDPYIAEKELADRYMIDPRDRADIVNTVVEIIENRAVAEGKSLTDDRNVTQSHGEHDGHDHAEEKPPVPVSVIEMLSEQERAAMDRVQTSIDLKDLVALPPMVEIINENEGAGLFDKLEMDKFETAIFDAVKGLSAESRRVMFGESKVLNEVNKGATGESAHYSYNEIETALKRLGLNDVSKIADVNGNGFDAEDIRAALVPSAGPSTNGQGNGR